MDTRELIVMMNEKQRRRNYFERHHSDILSQVLAYFSSENFTQSLYHFVHSMENIPKCDCGNSLNFRGFFQGYKRYCSRRCAMLDPAVVKKRTEKSRTTNLHRYGVDNPAKLASVIEKAKQTSLKKWGVDCFTKTTEYKQRMKEINLEKWGCEHFFSTEEFKIKSKESNLIKWKTLHPMQSEELRNKRKIQNEEKWGTDNFAKTEIFKEKQKEYFKSEKYNTALQRQKLITKNKILTYYQNYSDEVELKELKNNDAIFVCKKCESTFEISKQLIYLRNKNGHTICTKCNPKNRRSYSNEEKEVLSYIQKNYDGQIIENYRVKKQEADIYLPDLKLAFDFNGLYWHSELFKSELFHLKKKRFFEELGINLVYIWENDWLEKKEIVKSLILHSVFRSKRIFARNCIVNLTHNCLEIENFYKKNYLGNYKHTQINITLRFASDLVAVMSFEQRQNSWHMVSFCNKLNTSIVGSFSKMLSYFILNYHPICIHTETDYCFFNGKSLIASKFVLIESSSPGFFWANRKKRLDLPDKDSFRVFDCGLQKWLLRL